MDQSMKTPREIFEDLVAAINKGPQQDGCPTINGVVFHPSDLEEILDVVEDMLLDDTEDTGRLSEVTGLEADEPFTPAELLVAPGAGGKIIDVLSIDEEEPTQDEEELYGKDESAPLSKV